MPREVSDIKQFIEICRRKDASCMLPPQPPPFPSFSVRGCDFFFFLEGATFANILLISGGRTAARIKRNRKSQQIKFKVRCHRFLYTLVLKDSDKADKLKQSLPPSKVFPPIPTRSSALSGGGRKAQGGIWGSSGRYIDFGGVNINFCREKPNADQGTWGYRSQNQRCAEEE